MITSVSPRSSLRRCWLTSLFVVASSLSTFFLQFAFLRSRTSMMVDQQCMLNLSCLANLASSASRGQNRLSRNFFPPLGSSSKVIPMVVSSSQAQWIRSSSGRVPSGSLSTSSLSTCWTTFIDNMFRRYKFPIKVMFASRRYFCRIISVLSPSMSSLNFCFCSSVGAMVLGRRSYSSCTVFNRILLKSWGLSPSFSPGNSGYFSCRVTIMPA
mmetsp:Transcript_89088/g.238587  ORF Transcript_89088/g.238587 Transcript_89088/m.238587 type:complete len:212 (-) Transcript_89088:513-1148(-)